MSQFLDWCVGEGELGANPWEALKVKDRPEVHPHGVLTDDTGQCLVGSQGQGAAQCTLFRAPHRHALWGDLWAHGGGHHSKGQPGTVCQHQAQCGSLAEVQGSRAGGAAAWVLEQLLDTALPKLAGCSRISAVDKVVKRYAYLRSLTQSCMGTVFHSTRKWFITQCERTGRPGALHCNPGRASLRTLCQ